MKVVRICLQPLLRICLNDKGVVRHGERGTRDARKVEDETGSINLQLL